jgi:predicted DCC family thiol-disulfide oxidoreductase YuxK
MHGTPDPAVRGMTADGPMVAFDTDCVLCGEMVSFILAP